MPESHLWLVNHLGSVFTLGTFHRKFKQLQNTWDDAVSVKRLAASHWCAWAIGHDHRVYIYVRSSDVPIRVPETTFENQRWSPIHKFSKSGLIKTDRPAWSNEAGTVYRPKESVRLPSAHWEWEGDWLIDDNLRGEVVGREGWQYAFDFPAVYTPEKHWNSFVRKRKWIRFRRFSSTDVWARISDMEVVERAECFIDVSVGGFLMPSQPAGFLSVWAVTNNGHVYVRTNVNHDNPEGNTWQELEIADHLGIINISVGASNLVWAVSWDGNTLVRTHVTRNNIYGTGWVVVEHPNNSTRFMQVSVGKNSVWAISRENKVWFRKGTSGDDMFWSHESATGTSWVEMVGEMSQVAVSSNDQVFAIDMTGKNLCFRAGVTAVDLTGKTWQPVSLHEDLTILQKEGLLSEGDVCSCGDPETTCSLHMEKRPRLSSTTTTSSSISVTTNVEEISDGFISPLQPFPIHITEPFSILDSASSWRDSHFTASHSDISIDFQIQSQPKDSPASPSGVDISSCTFLPSDGSNTIHENVVKPLGNGTCLHQSFSSATTPSTSQTLTLSQHSSDDEIKFPPLLTASVVSSSAVNASHQKMESIHGLVLPELSKDTSTNINTLALTTEGKHFSALDTTSPENCCDSVEKINSEKYEIAQCDSHDCVEDSKVQKTSFIPFSEVAVDSVCLLRSESRVVTETMRCDDLYLPESNTILGDNAQKKNKTQAVNDSATSVSQESLALVQSDNRLNPSVTSAGVIITDSSPCVSQLVGAITESLFDLKINNNKEASRVSFEGNHSSPTVSNITFIDSEPLKPRPASDQKLIHKKKPKERRPKILDTSSNDPNDDSVLFKTFKTRRKRRENVTNTTNGNLEKTDNISISSDTSHGLTDVNELQIMNEGTSTSPDGREKETDVDFIDGHQYSEYLHQYSSDSIYQSLSPDASDYQLFPGLSSFSGDYLNAVGFNTDSAFTMLTDFDTAGTQNLYSQKTEEKRGIPRSTPATRTINSPNYVTSGSYKTSSPSFTAETSTKPGSTGHHINFSSKQGQSVQVSGIIPDQKSSNQAFVNDNSLKQDAGHLVRTDLIEKDRNLSVSLSNNTSENIPVQDDKHGAELKISATDINIEAIKESYNYSTPEHNANQSNGMVLSPEFTDNNNIDKQNLRKIGELVDNKFSSLDSASASEEILDFVTDLLVSDDEVLEKKNNLNEDKTQNGIKCPSENDEFEELSQTALESPSNIKSEIHSQISVASVRSTVSSFSNVVRDSSDESEQNESESIVQATSYQSYSSSQSTSHPKSLPFGSITSARKVSRYLKSPSPSYVPVGNIVPLIALTMAQPRLSWKWLDATSCVIDDPSAVEWLSNTSKESEPRKKFVKIAKQLREDIMRKLQERNKKEVHKFKDFEQAVKRTTWVKKASMQMYLYGRKNRWIACNVELEQGISNLSEGFLTIHYQHKGKQKNTQISLSEMICVKTCSDSDIPSGFVVYTPVTNIIHQPLQLKANSENEAADWIGGLASANAAAWNMNCSVAPGAIWSCTFIGDVFVSSVTSTSKNPTELCWGQHGGHMRLAETGPSGVTWALGFDRMPYVYNGGYGGAISNGTSEMSNNTQQIMDHHKVFVYENQTWFPVIGWCCKGVFHNDFHWLTETGRSIQTKEEVKLPSSKCQWISEWTVDFSTHGGVDTNGWQYSSNLYGPFYPRQHLRSSYRRRRWFRQYKLTVFGPWHAAGSLGLVDLSVQIDPVTSTSAPVVLWAVGANGDVLCRNGVTASNPKGQSWIHVATDLDKPFKSISVGGSYRVWGIAGDGSAWFRPGVSPYNQAGNCWLQVVPPPPSNFLLHQVSAGATSVWAVDTGDNLWRRENITPTFPEGTGWEFIASRVKRVSVGPRDQVWIIADASFSKMKHGAGVIYSRVGITSTRPSGTDWEVVIGSGWAHVSIRGVSEIKLEDFLPSLEEESSI